MLVSIIQRLLWPSAPLTTHCTNTRLVNSNRVDFTEIRGDYNGSMLFTAKDEENSSSFSFTGFSSFELDKPMHQYSTIETQLQNTSDSLEAEQIPDKFVGDMIITPDAIDDFHRLSDWLHS